MKILELGENYSGLCNAGTCDPAKRINIMTDSAILKSGKAFFIPEFAQRFSCQPHIALRIGRLGKNIAPKFAHRYIDAITSAVTIKAHNITDGTPDCDICTAFDGAVLLGDFIEVSDATTAYNASAEFLIGETPVNLCASNLRFGINDIVAYVSRYFALKMGDIILSGHPNISHFLAQGEVVDAKVNQQHVLNIKIR